MCRPYFAANLQLTDCTRQFHAMQDNGQGKEAVVMSFFVIPALGGTLEAGTVKGYYTLGGAM